MVPASGALTETSIYKWSTYGFVSLFVYVAYFVCLNSSDFLVLFNVVANLCN